MYFFKKDGKQVLDLRGDLILTHNDDLVRTRVKSAAPRYVRNATYICGIPELGFMAKVRASFMALGFIWGKSQKLENLEE